jgi:hypothetical protein
MMNSREGARTHTLFHGIHTEWLYHLLIKHEMRREEERFFGRAPWGEGDIVGTEGFNHIGCVCV